MDFFFLSLKKVLVATLFLVFGFVAVYVPQPFNEVKKADAIFGIVLDPTNLVQTTATAIASTANLIKEKVLDGLAWAIAKRIVSNMMRSLITWVNSGFSGSPSFIQDLDKFLLQAADEVVGERINNLGGIGSFICSPFRLNIQIALSIKYQQTRQGKPLAACTLSGVFNNFENFIEGNFQRGGWKDWITLTAQPEKYTPYGQFLAAESYISIGASNKKSNELQKASWGKGFLSKKTCEAGVGPNGPIQNCVISTPGTVIAASLNKALGSPTDALIQADEIDELIGALMGQLANKAISGAAGLLGLSPGTGHTENGFAGGSYLNQMDREMAGLVNTENTAQNITDSLAIERQFNTLARTYVPLLASVDLDPTATEEKRAEALQAGYRAQDIIDRTNTNITALTTLSGRAQTLQTEFDLTATPPARKDQIKDLLAAIVNEYSRLPLHSASEVKAAEVAWRTLTQ